MPELLDNDRKLAVGDVLMVSRTMRDKKTNKLFAWKFFMVLSEVDEFAEEVHGYVLGTTNERLKGEPLRLYIGEPKNTVHFLPQDEWPDGVHAFRMGLILP